MYKLSKILLYLFVINGVYINGAKCEYIRRLQMYNSINETTETYNRDSISKYIHQMKTLIQGGLHEILHRKISSELDGHKKQGHQSHRPITKCMKSLHTLYSSARIGTKQALQCKLNFEQKVE